MIESESELIIEIVEDAIFELLHENEFPLPQDIHFWIEDEAFCQMLQEIGLDDPYLKAYPINCTRAGVNHTVVVHSDKEPEPWTDFLGSDILN